MTRRVLTLPGRRLRNELRQLRDERGMTLAEVVKEAREDFSTPTLSRWEDGGSLPRRADLRRLLEVYDVDDATSESLFHLLSLARQPGWWTPYRRVLKTGFEEYLGLEADAATIQTYAAILVPGLLQTETYAREIIRAGLMSSKNTKELDRLVAMRMKRQELLTRAEHPLNLDAVLDEAVLRRHGRKPKTMRDQLRRLTELAELPNVTIRVLPFERGAHPAMEGAFYVLEFPAATDPAAIYFEHATTGFSVDDQAEVRQYVRRFGHLSQLALDPEASAKHMLELADGSG